ncbi:hypothetical protein B0H15DRAFT_797777 [Mycena belliarum]|uniref:Uncharacterized protein n=1 Tax=Mycena belliarum TaxID=1033014 RepID=A0AAD6UBH7_9AGAR|nr:hypothetical protein B0H15DRAFT_797777 [Mycena belliae]
MIKLEFPKLTEEPTPVSIHSWLGRCEDTFETWQAQSTDKALEARTLITLAGLRMEETMAATWWSENRAELKKLKTWEEFAQKVKDRFVPSNWRMTALSAFYAIYQGALPFPEFAKTLQRARNSLASAGTGYTISDSILKNHLLFHAHPVLRLRVCGQQDFSFASMKVDGLVANMSATWESLIAEKVIKPAPNMLPSPNTSTHPSASSLPTPTSASPAASAPTFRPLTYAEKEALRAAHRCYHCRKTPQTPGWVKHRSDSCPGDSALGIPPRASAHVVAAVGPVGFSAAYEEGYAPIAVVFPSHSDDEGSFSSATDDDDLSTRDD